MKHIPSRFTIYVLMIAIFSAITPLTANSNAVGDADRDLFRYIHEDMENRFFDAALPTVQRMGDSRVYAGACMLLCAFGDEKMARTGKLAAAAFVEAGLVTHALKYITSRPRPLNEEETDSFPSGHATMAFAIAAIAGHEYKRLRIPLYIAAFGTAFSRVYLGRHYPGDVMAGAVIGTLSGLVTIHYRKAILEFSF